MQSFNFSHRISRLSPEDMKVKKQVSAPTTKTTEEWLMLHKIRLVLFVITDIYFGVNKAGKRPTVAKERFKRFWTQNV